MENMKQTIKKDKHYTSGGEDLIFFMTTEGLEHEVVAKGSYEPKHMLHVYDLDLPLEQLLEERFPVMLVSVFEKLEKDEEGYANVTNTFEATNMSPEDLSISIHAMFHQGLRALEERGDYEEMFLAMSATNELINQKSFLLSLLSGEVD